MKHVWKLLAIIVSIFFVGYFLEETIDLSGINNPQLVEQTIEIISELFSVFVALSIFGITWYAYNKSKDNHSLFLGTTFLITGLLILFHLLSYPFMPDFITPNSSHKAAIFFLDSRFFLAFLFLASVFVHKDSCPKLINKYVLVFFTIAIMSVTMVFLFLPEDFLFNKYNIDTYSTATIILLLFVISAFILTASYLYRKRSKKTGEDNLNIIYGSLIVLISNLVYFFYEFSGHFLIITGFFYFYLGLYKSSVELPYEKLSIAEEKLRKGVENKYRNLFDNANDSIITTDIEDRVTSWNRSSEKLFGWDAQEVIGKKLSSLIVPLNLRTRKEGLIHDTLSGKAASGIETVRLHKDGSSIFVDLTTSQLLDSNNILIGLSFIFRDITQRKKTEDLLNKSKEFAETIINSMNDAISVIDVNNFRITDVNTVFLKNYGMKKEEVIGKTCHEITHKRTQRCTHPDQNCPLIETLNTGKYSMAEHVHYSMSGEKRYVEISTSPIKDENGKVINAIYVARDITERRLAENTIENNLKQLEEEKAKTESIIAALGDALSIQDTDFKVIYQNKIHQDLMGDQKGNYCYREYENKDHVCEGCPVNMSFKDGKIHTEERSVQKGEQKLCYEITSSPLRDSTGNIIAGIEVARNITQRKETEEALSKNRNLLDTIKSVQDTYIVDFDIKVTFNEILTSLLCMTQSEYGFIGEILYTEKGEPYLKTHAITNIAWNKETLEFYEHNSPKGMEFFNQKTLFGAVLTGGKPVIANNPLTDPRRAGLPEGHPPLNTFLGIPFYQGGKLIGIIGIANRPLGYNEGIIEYLNPLLNTCANIIEAYRNDQLRKVAEKKIEDSLKEKETLLKEIHHRVKNNMQIISSLLNLQTQNIEDKKYKDIFIDSQTRIHAMALIHEKLYQSEDLAQINFKEYVDEIVSNIFSSYCQNSNIKIEINVQNIMINIDNAVPCGLIINEIVTNSLKYAFPDGRQGMIKISVESKEKNMIQLSISDDGIGIAKDMDIRNNKTLGLTLITALAENQLNGELIINREKGTEFQINFRGTK